MAGKIEIKGAKTHNLKNIDLQVAHDKLSVMTGVSGSGKSSLAFDTICKEGQRLYLETLPAYARLYTGKLDRPEVDSISGLRATVALNQLRSSGNIRSTVGTVTELYDILRLLFARLGEYRGNDAIDTIDRNLFSFNSPHGACPECRGLGVVERISPKKLIRDPQLSIREGALVPTTPTGYIVYSQVTLDVLNTVCQSHGFNIEIPWKEMTEAQRNVIYYGSEKIKIPFGKHPLESRMKWSGITAKPREEGYYKGMIPIMDEILKRDRNKNILRFAVSQTCPACNGDRLNQQARSVYFDDKTIAEFNRMEIAQLQQYFSSPASGIQHMEILVPFKEEIIKRTDRLIDLGLGYLNLNRETPSLSGGELQRVRFATQTGTDLSGILYILDEPTIGLHARDNHKLADLMVEMKQNGNTVCIVEHDKEIMKRADQIIDLGPGAGIEGGRLLIDDKPENLKKYKGNTADYFSGKKKISIAKKTASRTDWIDVIGANKNNLKNIKVSFRKNAMNVVTGVSGAGKSSLVKQAIGDYVNAVLQKQDCQGLGLDRIEGIADFKHIIEIDSTPIGRTPRSNPATYINLFDLIRDLFAQLPLSRQQQKKKGDFSFNIRGGRCEACQGAGIRSVGMFFIGDVKIPCDQCHGKRFQTDILKIRYRDKNIYDVLEMSFREADTFFSTEPKILRMVQTVNKLGLGYLKLGQPASTLSGGEAQRIKLAAQLSRNTKGKTLYLFDEPTIGLSDSDIQVLLVSMHELIHSGHTLILIEHNLDIISLADHIVDLGPNSGEAGGRCVASGLPEQIMKIPESHTGEALRKRQQKKTTITAPPEMSDRISNRSIRLGGVQTNNLKNIDIQIPKNQLTVITGISGSGKSSLAFDSIYAEAHKKFIERLSIYARQFLKAIPPADIESVSGLTPTIGIKQNIHSNNPRATVGTLSGLYNLLRLLYARAAEHKGANCISDDISENRKDLYSEIFSFNDQSGACHGCNGMGVIISTDPDKLISHPEHPFFDGGMKGHKTGRFYGDPNGQYRAILDRIGEIHDIDFHVPIRDLSDKARNMALYGTGDRIYSVNWNFKRKERTGTFRMEQPWPGFIELVNTEYRRKSMLSSGKSIRELMMEIPCPDCKGKRLNPDSLSYTFLDMDISSLSSLSVRQILTLFSDHAEQIRMNPIANRLILDMTEKMTIIQEVGLAYLSLDRRLDSISHGEYQRLQLAVQMVNGLEDMTYILDEPTQGLHQRDVAHLIQILVRLKEKNTVIIVEHDLSLIRSADHIIDLGPGAGTAGGEIIATGSPEEILESESSITGQYLKRESRRKRIPKKKKLQQGIRLTGVQYHNIKNLDIEIPVGGIIVFSGVSGSGKTSLLFDTLYQSLYWNKAIHCQAIRNDQNFDEIIKIDQSPIGNTPLATAATYIGIFDQIRTLYSETDEARIKKMSKKHFSFNNKEGQCDQCKGLGQSKISMDFLSDIWIRCEACQGSRYQQSIRSIRVKGRSIDQLLDSTVDEATLLLNSVEKLVKPLKLLQEIGLGYLKLGQGLNTISGGEAQRLKIVRELLQSPKKGGLKLFLMDEPSTGLHRADVEILLRLFRRLTDAGHTLMIIEHDLDIIAEADWIIDMGPEGGDRGGQIVAQGTPADLIGNHASHTGAYLNSYFR